jgi:two-component system, response regulator PdtaR
MGTLGLAGDLGPESPPTVVVAEDEALIRLDLVEMLDELGYRVVGQAADGQQAVDLARSMRPSLALLDIAMPVRDGLSAAEEIAAEGIAPVVIITAFSQRDAVARAASAGVLGYLVKPFTRSDLVPVIEVALSRWAQVTGLQEEVGDLRERLAARDVVERAKRRLQAERSISEAQAFAALRRQAMDARVTLAEAALAYLVDVEASLGGLGS